MSCKGVRLTCVSLVLLAAASVGGLPLPACAAQPQEQAPERLPPGVTSQYRIGPGDMLDVFVWRNPDLSQKVPVRPDGRVSTPLVENMVAAGKTPSQLAKDMEAVLSRYIRSPKVNIIVTQPLSLLSEVKVVGQVAHPEAIPYRAGLTVLDVMLQAGGLGPFAAGNRARLIRKVDGKTTEIHIRLVNLLQKGDMSQNVTVQPGDIIVVPETYF